jgi:hypothetical protein
METFDRTSIGRGKPEHPAFDHEIFFSLYVDPLPAER